MTSGEHASPVTPTGSSVMSELDALAREYGNRFLLEPAPDHRLAKHGMRAGDAVRLFHAPEETAETRAQGSSESIMLGALSLKWKWRARREAAGKDTARPNLVFGGGGPVVWGEVCRYFGVE